MQISFLKRYRFHFLGILLSLIPFVVYLNEYPYSPQRDWNYFNSLALITKSYLTRFELPLLDPWICGGIDTLANPQNWVYSPLVLLYFIFSPYIANLISIFICAVLGYFGMWKLCENEESKFNRTLLAVIFTLSPFFFLHFVEGHLVYRTFYLLPWVLHYSRKLISPKEGWILCAILSFMFLDGGLYPFYFSLILILINLPYKVLGEIAKQKEKYFVWFLILAGGVFLLMAKAAPVLSVHYSRVPEHEITQYSLRNIFEALFSIRQSNYFSLEGMQYLGHEYYHYMGVSIVLLLIMGLRQFKTNKFLLIQITVFLWIALGIGGVFNPWSVIKAIPLINHIHVQSRFLVVVFLLLLYFISQIKIPSRWKSVLLVLAVGEFLYSGIYINQSGFQEKLNSQDLMITEIYKNQQTYQLYIAKPLVYQSGGLSLSCYEPAKNNIKASSQLFLNGGRDLAADFDFNKIRIHSQETINERILFNFGWNGGWDCENCDVYENSGIIEIKPTKRTNEIMLEYNPYHRQFSLLFFVLGIFFMGVSFRRLKNEF